MRASHVAVIIGAGSFLAAWCLAPGAADDKPQPGKTVVVPKEAIHISNADQTPPKPKGWSKDDEEQYQSILRSVAHSGVSNVFLVRGKDLREAMDFTTWAYNERNTHNARANETLPPWRDHLPEPGKPAGRSYADVWVVAHLGSSSSDRWSINSVERTGTRIRVSYVDHGPVRGDIEPYILWAPLGQLPGGKYAVELYEVNAEEVKLTRTVRVEQPADK